MLDASIILLLILLNIAVLCSRMRFFAGGPLWDDAFTYLKIARKIRDEKQIPRNLSFFYNGTSPGEPFTIPPLFIVLLSPFSKLKYGQIIYISTFLDLIISISVFTLLFAYYKVGFYASALAALMYNLTPINTTTSVRITPRPLAQLLLFMTVFSLQGYLFYAEPFLLGICISLATLTLLSQRMATQILVLVLPFSVAAFSLRTGSLYPFYFALIPAIAFVLATTLSRGHYISVFLDHIRRIRLHARYGDQNNFKKSLVNPISILKNNPWTLFLILPLIFGHKEAPLIFFFASGILLLSILWIFGNGENHIYFITPFLLISCSTHFEQRYVQLAIVFISLISVIYVFKLLRFLNNGRVSTDWYKIFEFVNANRLAGKVLVLPRISCNLFPYYTKLRVFSAGHGSGAMSINRIFLRRNIGNPQFIADLIQKHNVEYVLTDRSSFSMQPLPKWNMLISAGALSLYSTGILNV